MPTKSTLKWLVILEITLLIIYSQVAELKPAANLQPFGVYDSGSSVNQGNDIVMNRLEWAIGIILLLIGLAAYVGLLRFMPWGRRWYVIFHALSLALLPLGKPVLTTGWESLFNGIIAMVTGAVLALLFLTPLKEHFGRKKPEAHAAPESAAPAVACAINSGNLVDRVKDHSEEEKTAAPQPEGPEALKTLNEKNLIDRITDWLFPKSAAARASEEPPERKKKRCALLLEHYVFMFFIVFVIVLTEFKINGLVIVALCFVLFNLAQRKGDSFAVLSPALLAVYCLVPIASSLFGYMLSNFSKSFLLYLIPYIIGWLLLLLLEVRTYKFIRKYDQPSQESTKSEAPRVPEP